MSNCHVNVSVVNKPIKATVTYITVKLLNSKTFYNCSELMPVVYKLLLIRYNKIYATVNKLEKYIVTKWLIANSAESV